jgi:hypothetical protein
MERKMPHLEMEFLGSFPVTMEGSPLAIYESNKVGALLVGITRMYVEAHYSLDVLVGAILGSARGLRGLSTHMC